MNTIWNPGLMSKYGGVVEWGFPGTALHSYQCGSCYQLTLNAAAPTVPMSMPPKTEPPPGTTCSSCGVVLRPVVEVPW